MTFPYDTLPKPLPVQEFYILLALQEGPSHIYGLKRRTYEASLGSVAMSDGRLYQLVAKLEHKVLIDLVSKEPAGPSGKERLHYGTNERGTLRLREEFKRLEHALEVGRSLGLAEKPEVPIDIQMLMLDQAIKDA